LSGDFLYAFEKQNTLSPRGISLLLEKKKEQYSVCVYEAVDSLGPPSKQTDGMKLCQFFSRGEKFSWGLQKRRFEIVFAGYLF